MARKREVSVGSIPYPSERAVVCQMKLPFSEPSKPKMKQREIISLLEIITENFKDVRDETIADSEYYTDDILRNKAKYTLLRLVLEDEDV